MSSVLCSHRRRVLARDVNAIIQNGHLIGWEGLPPKTNRPMPLSYDAILFCGNPICEKVFKAARKVEEV